MRALLAFLSCLYCTLLFSQDPRLVYAWVSNNDSFESLVIVNNLGDGPAEITLTARRGNGEQETVSRTVEAAGFLNETASSLFPGLGPGAGYSVVVSSDLDRLAGRWITFQRVTGTGNSPSQGVAVPFSELASGTNQRLGQRILFGYLPLTADFFAAPVVVNLGDSATDVALYVYNQQGALVMLDTQTMAGLEPFRPFAVLMSSLVPDTIEPLNVVAVSEDQPLTGVSFVFNTGGEPSIGNVTGLADLPGAVSFGFQFSESLEGWTAGFADYPVGEDEFYELAFDHRDLPAELGTQGAMFLSGNNHSDDLFMFVKRKVEGLVPNANYLVRFRIMIASNAGMGCPGSGGAPGETVFFKAGASVFEPLAIDEDGTLRMNIDKGNQAAGGRAMQVLDNIAVDTDCLAPDYVYKRFDNADQLFEVKTDPSGAIWLIAGTDSGFEAVTCIYFSEFEARFFRLP